MKEISCGCVVQLPQWSQEAGFLNSDYVRLPMVFYNWVLEKIFEDGDFTVSLCDLIQCCTKGFPNGKCKPHKSQPRAAAPHFTICHCQEVDSYSHGCPSSSCRLIFLLAFSSTEWINQLPQFPPASRYLTSMVFFHWVFPSFPASYLNLNTKLDTYCKCSLTGIELK